MELVRKGRVCTSGGFVYYRLKDFTFKGLEKPHTVIKRHGLEQKEREVED